MASQSNSVGQSSSEQGQKLPAATPTYVLRGHVSPIHTLHFYNKNSRLVSGDADGWVIVWCMTSKRAVAAWKAHDGAILGARGVELEKSGKNGNEGEMRIFTHGRDHKLCVWKLNLKDEELIDKVLPVHVQEDSQTGNEPWLIHSLAVNALNFCSFAMCFFTPKPSSQTSTGKSKDTPKSSDSAGDSTGGDISHSPHILLAISNTLNTGGIDIFHLPSERRISTIPTDPSRDTGMVMALELFASRDGGQLYVISGYEDGTAMVHVHREPMKIPVPGELIEPDSAGWDKLYMNRPHSQPVLSLDISPTEKNYFLTSSADAMIVKHPIPKLAVSSEERGTKEATKTITMPLKVLNTKHAGQQGLRIRSDEKIFVTAGWDFRTRVYSCKTMKELAVLKWHKEGCYAIAIADANIDIPTNTINREGTGTPDSKSQRGSTSLTSRTEGGSLATIKEQRSRKAQLTHWIAAGSKDGKVSLWDIY